MAQESKKDLDIYEGTSWQLFISGSTQYSSFEPLAVKVKKKSEAFALEKKLTPLADEAKPCTPKPGRIVTTAPQRKLNVAAVGN